MPLVTANIFQPLIDVFEAVIKFFHGIGLGWGLSIIALTVVIRALLIPLTLRQFRSMQGLQRLQPEIKALQAKYKGDKQRLNQEMMKFYQQNKVNPLGSCLPLLAQFPVFIGLFYMLRKDLRINICPSVQHAYQALHHTANTTPCGPHVPQAHFLFITDLTNNATGAVLVVLIALYIATQLVSSLLMSATTDRNQRLLMLGLPFVFTVFIIRFPAGLILYWITTNTWTILQQYIVRKRVGPLHAPGSPGALALAGGGDTADSKGAGGGGLRGLIQGLRDGAASSGGGNGAADRGSAERAVGRKPARASAQASAKASAKRSGKASGDDAGTEKGPRREGKAPPPPPRKRKTRSGRRR
ncbi:MAG: YidC/Oxa1 family membrane protein insertase [Solirubrobacteraceae bacterium]